MFVIIRFTELVTSYLEKDLNCSVDHAHPPAQEGEEWENELNEVVGQCLEAMKPPRRAMHVVGHGVWNWLRLKSSGEALSENVTVFKTLETQGDGAFRQQKFQNNRVRQNL